MSHEKHKCECVQLKEILYGSPGKPHESMAWVMATHDEMLNGTKTNPGGIVAELTELRDKVESLESKLNKIIWVGIGMGIASNIVWALFTHFSKP